MQFLVSVDEVKRRGIVHQNVDTKLISIAITRAQDINIQTALNTCLYKELLRRVKEDEWNANYSELMNEYVLPALIAFVDYRACDLVTDRVMNRGTGTLQDTNFNPMSDSERNPLRDRLRKDAYFYKERLIGYLCDDNGVKFPLYTDCECKKENVQKEKEGFKVNWH